MKQKKIVKRLLQGRKFESQPEKILHRILGVTVVIPSAQMGLLGDLKKLAISGDGSLYATGSALTEKRSAKFSIFADWLVSRQTRWPPINLEFDNGLEKP